MSKIITQCPSCDSLNLSVVKLECQDCKTKFEGSFDIPALLRLNESDLAFIFDFVKCSGSLKEMAAKQKVSYPTLRNRLNLIIKTIENLNIKLDLDREDVLKMLEDGSITAKEAAKLLYTM